MCACGEVEWLESYLVLVEKLNGLSGWCKVTVLRLKDCCVWRYGAGRLAEAIASFLSTPLVELDLEGNIIEDGGGRTWIRRRWIHQKMLPAHNCAAPYVEDDANGRRKGRC